MMESENNISNAFTEEVTKTRVGRDSYYYDMNHKEQGLAYIFSHGHVVSHDKRNAADVDDRKLKNCLGNLGFDVHLFIDLKVKEIKEQIASVISMDHKDRNCFLLFVLSHGDENKVQAADEPYNPSEVLWSQFTADKCPSLAAKPKLFFMQCCQGDKLDPGHKLSYAKSEIETDGGNEYYSYKIPIYCDMLIMYATLKGHFAFRNSRRGAFFITALCEELIEHAYNEHLLTILTFVIRRVAVEFESNTKEEKRSKKKQTPYFESSLTRLVQFQHRGLK